MTRILHGYFEEAVISPCQNMSGAAFHMIQAASAEKQLLCLIQWLPGMQND